MSLLVKKVLGFTWFWEANFFLRNSIIFREVEKFIVYQTPGIERCVEREELKDGNKIIYLQTQGVNLQVCVFIKKEDGIISI